MRDPRSRSEGARPIRSEKRLPPPSLGSSAEIRSSVSTCASARASVRASAATEATEATSAGGGSD